MGRPLGPVNSIESAARRKWLRFAKLMVDVTDMNGQVKAYRTVFPNCKTKNTAISNSYKLLKKPEVLEVIHKCRREKEEQIADAAKQERIRLAKLAVAHEFELDAVLSGIAMKRQTRKKQVPVYNPDKKVHEMIVIEEEPSESDQIQAADKLYKRKGSYAPTKLQHDGTDSFLNFFAQLATVGNSNITNADTRSSESKI
jgi:hypothetical protein